MDLVLTALGVSPKFPVKRPSKFVFGVDRVEVRRQKADSDHSDSDWLSIVVTIGDAVTKDVMTLPAKLHHVEGSMKSGDVITGPFLTDPFVVKDTDIVTG
jgi:hypothetical protein